MEIGLLKHEACEKYFNVEHADKTMVLTMVQDWKTEFRFNETIQVYLTHTT